MSYLSTRVCCNGGKVDQAAPYTDLAHVSRIVDEHTDSTFQFYFYLVSGASKPESFILCFEDFINNVSTIHNLFVGLLSCVVLYCVCYCLCNMTVC